MVAAILDPPVRLCRNAAGANLLSGIAAALVDGAGGGAAGRARAVRVRRGGAAQDRAPRATAHAGAREPLPRPARPLRRARGGRRALARHARRAAARDDGDRLRRRSADRRHHVRPRPHRQLRDRRPRARSRAARARRRLAVLRALRHALQLRDRLVRAPRRLPLPELRTRAAPARDHRLADPAARPRGGHLRAAHADRQLQRRARRPRAVQRRERARRERRRARPRRIARRDRRRPRALPPGLRTLPAHLAGRSRGRDAADQEPGRRQRGPCDARARRGRRPARDDRPERPDRRRHRRLLDLGRRLGADRALARARRGDRYRGRPTWRCA